MVIVGFNKIGFKLMHQEDRYVYHVEDGSHLDLLNYIDTDLSELEKLVQQYVAKIIDTDTLELTGYKPQEEDTLELLAMFKHLHPVYLFEHKNALKREVCEYFNKLLYEQWKVKKIAYSEQWYAERYEILTAFNPTGIKMRFDDKYYRKYAVAIGADNKEDWEVALFPLHYESEKKTQDFIKLMLFYILNLSIPELTELTIRQRIWLFNNIVGEQIFDVSLRLLLEPPRYYENDSEFRNRQQKLVENYELLVDGKTVGDYHINYGNVTEEQASRIQRYVAKAKALTDDWYYEEYEVQDTRQLLFLEIVQMIKNGLSLRYCKLCGRYFIPKHQRKVYCDGYAPGETQPCSKIGPKRNYENQSEIILYSRAYKKYAAKVTREKNPEIRSAFKNWCFQAAEMRDKVKSGEINIMEFAKWLEKNDFSIYTK